MKPDPLLRRISPESILPIHESAVSARRVLTTTSLVSLSYFAICGGPFGSEQTISAGGPLLGITGLLVTPLVMSIPTALMTAELSTAFPASGGFVFWVLHAFGPFWASMVGYVSWVSGVIDNAIYPSLALASFIDVYGGLENKIALYLVKAAIALVLTIPNLLGLKLVGNAMAAGFIFIILPFIVLVIWAFVTADDWGALGELHRTEFVVDANGDVIGMTGDVDIDWSTLLQTLYWNYSGTISISVFGGEVKNPSQSYPRALLVSTMLIVLTYTFPLLASSAFNRPNWSTWEEGEFASIAKSIGGVTLLTWMMIATLVSNAGMFITEMCSDSYQLAGMAEIGLVPACFATRNQRFGTPHWAIAASFVFILILTTFDFDEILTMTNALSALHQICSYCSFIKLRYSHAETFRPFKVPGTVPFLVAMLVIPMALLLYITQDVFHTLFPALLVISVLLLGVVYAKWKKPTHGQLSRLNL
uniref:Amino AcidPolyamineOrganocation (APC) Family putati n=1 Tax=Albugo laibachii Nc14 TaxID=890382 RepID=F0W0S6_9STRA|nr:Amino AcidPolyamineOrganocation (APC) Family putati [Albugo laibachii Nc14]|eukprot:CCA14650.1 Amino AcidPolyamineOrganocation (APC) Family putati [Albugo laibachii Nc14]